MFSKLISKCIKFGLSVISYKTLEVVGMLKILNFNNISFTDNNLKICKQFKIVNFFKKNFSHNFVSTYIIYLI